MSRETITLAAIVVVLLTVAGVWSIHASRADLASPEAQIGSTTAVQTRPATTPSAVVPADPRPPSAADSPATAAIATTPDPPTSTPFRAPEAERMSPPTPSPTATAASTRSRDYDGDGIPDTRDRCPTRPERPNGFQDDDGCPDVVTTTGAS